MNLFRLCPVPVLSLVIPLLVCVPARAEPTPTAVSRFNTYIGTVEERLVQQHRTQAGFLAPLDAAQQERLRKGEPVLQNLSPQSGDDLPGALLHHWRGTIFAPGAKAADLDHLLKNFEDYPRVYAPEILQANVLSRQGDRIQAFMRIRRQQALTFVVLTVVFDTWYDVTYGHLDPQHGYSLSHSTKISEIAAPGTRDEHALSPADDHGYLWWLNTYWTWEERDGGLYMQIESISLTRNIPPGLAWAVRPFIERVPRESLEFTLRSTLKGLHR